MKNWDSTYVRGVSFFCPKTSERLQVPHLWPRDFYYVKQYKLFENKYIINLQALLFHLSIVIGIQYLIAYRKVTCTPHTARKGKKICPLLADNPTWFL